MGEERTIDSGVITTGTFLSLQEPGPQVMIVTVSMVQICLASEHKDSQGGKMIASHPGLPSFQF